MGLKVRSNCCARLTAVTVWACPAARTAIPFQVIDCFSPQYHYTWREKAAATKIIGQLSARATGSICMGRRTWSRWADIRPLGHKWDEIPSWKIARKGYSMPKSGLGTISPVSEGNSMFRQVRSKTLTALHKLTAQMRQNSKLEDRQKWLCQVKEQYYLNWRETACPGSSLLVNWLPLHLRALKKESTQKHREDPFSYWVSHSLY